jgi:hypothetical protein
VAAETPEQARNARLRRVDWRFLLPSPRPRRALCLATGPLAEAVASIAEEVVGADDARACDLAVAMDPDGPTLARLYGALGAAGICYTEWQPRFGGAAAVERALRAAGFEEITCYRLWPAAADLPVFRIPVAAPGAAAYVRSRQRLRGGRLRRLVAEVRRRARDLLSGRAGAPLCALARRPGASTDEPAPAEWLRREWPRWNVGPPPPRLSTLLVTGGPRSVSKVVLLAFAEPSAIPVVVVKTPRVSEAVAGVRREAEVLAELGRRRPEGVPGVPRLLARRDVAGVPLVCETAIVGRPLDAVLTRRSLAHWSGAVTDWLAALVPRQPPRSADHWREAIAEPALARFAAEFGGVVDPAVLRSGEALVRGIGSLPAVPEQRDFGPWNVLVTPAGGIAVLDWESAEVDGLPVLDLLYFLAHAAFAVDGARSREQRIVSFRRSLDPATPTGAVRRDALGRYVAALGLDASQLAPLRALVWLIHAQSDARHAAADAGGAPPPSLLARSLFLGLWEEEVRHAAGR